MLPFDDDRWRDLKGGYRMPFDPRPFLARIDSGQDAAAAWHELWEELHHQGDVGEASYAAVPYLVEMCRLRNGVIWAGWDLCALVGTIELARRNNGNPELPEWCKDDYFSSLADLGALAATDLVRTSDQDKIRALLCIVALSKSLPIHARFLINYSEEEMHEIEQRTHF